MKLLLRYYFFCILIIAATMLNSVQGAISRVGPTPSFQKINHCSSTIDNDGSLVFRDMPKANTQYVVNYKLNSVAATPTVYTSDANSFLKVDHLGVGKYSDFTISNPETTDTAITITGEYTIAIINIGNIATQTTKFFGAIYSNFGAIADDDPTGYTQVYARLSVPLPPGRKNGLNPNASWCQRWISFRNLLFTVTYGNTDKLQATQIYNDRYVNRLDLFAHAYVNAGLSINLVTLVMPTDWRKSQHNGDLGHVYLDFITGYLVTNIVDNKDPANPKNFTVPSNLWGLNLKAAFYQIAGTPWSTEIGIKGFQLFSASGSVNSGLNAQYANLADSSLALNSKRYHNIPATQNYWTSEALVQYNTSTDPFNASNIFLKFSYTTNFRTVGDYYPNNYWQLKIGYVLDITKVFAKKPTQ